MKNDRGAAALAALLHDTYGCRITCRGGRLADDRHPSHTEAYLDTAERLLGERGRFLPDGENRPDVLRELDLISRAASAQVEVERYKAALAAVVAAWDDDATPEDDGFDPMTHAIDSARAALSPEPKP